MLEAQSPGASSTEEPLRLLIADDDQNDVDLCLRHLRKSGVTFEADCVSTRDELAERLQKQRLDIVLSDYRMGSWTGLDALAIVRQIQPDVPLILMTATLGDELAVESIKAGVTDYILRGQLARLLWLFTERRKSACCGKRKPAPSQLGGRANNTTEPWCRTLPKRLWCSTSNEAF
jgi:DNA-binding NtrC family response regulator